VGKKSVINIFVTRLWILMLLAVLSGPTTSARATDPPASGEAGYFYRGLSYGSDAAFHPLSELVNGAFGIFQISSNWEMLDDVDWQRGLDVTWRSITNPFDTVESYGWGDFLTNEMIPGKLRWNNLQYLPNYHLLLIGGGARHRAFVEWYGAHGFKIPGIWAAATSVLHAFAVEAVEHSNKTGPTVDPIADMLFFDPAGALLFSSDRVSRFFAERLNMSIWSGQPMYNPVLNSCENAGQNYAFHYYFAEGQSVGIFQYWGMSDLMGITVRNERGVDWSIGFGGMVDELREEERDGGLSSFYARLKWDAGFFIHRNGSLLASVQVSE
jgi:hypothetical protein